MDELRRYELYVVFQPELDDEQLETRIGRTNGYITSNRGEIVEVVRKGKRRLHYPIQRFNQGIDVIYQANLPASALEPMERQLNLNEDVIRYLVIRREDLEGQQRLAVSQEQVEASVAKLQAESPEGVLFGQEAEDQAEPDEAGEDEIGVPDAEDVSEEDASEDQEIELSGDTSAEDEGDNS